MRKLNVINFPSTNRRDTERGFLLLAEAAARGQIIGAGYTVIDAGGKTRQGWFGAAEANPALAHYGATRLAALLLWPDQS